MWVDTEWIGNKAMEYGKKAVERKIRHELEKKGRYRIEWKPTRRQSGVRRDYQEKKTVVEYNPMRSFKAVTYNRDTPNSMKTICYFPRIRFKDEGSHSRGNSYAKEAAIKAVREWARLHNATIKITLGDI